MGLWVQQRVLGLERRRQPDWFRESGPVLSELIDKRNLLFSRWLRSRRNSDRQRYGRRQKKVPISRLYNRTGNSVPFPFRSHLISVRLPFLSVFKPFPFCPTGSPSVLVVWRN